MEVKEQVRTQNEQARRLLLLLHAWSLKSGDRPFFVHRDDPESLRRTGLDEEAYMQAAARLVAKGLAKRSGALKMLTITKAGIRVAEDDGALDRELPISSVSEAQEDEFMNAKSGNTAKSTGARIFISHAGTDAELAKRLISLIEAGLETPTGTIRCTSVDGYKLDGGDNAPEVLRENLKECAVVLGILTKASVSSSYVLMELGAAWAFKKRAIPLIGPGVTFEDLPGPFKDIHALKMAHEPDMAGLIATISKDTHLTETGNWPKIQAALKSLVTALAQPPLAQEPSSTRFVQ